MKRILLSLAIVAAALPGYAQQAKVDNALYSLFKSQAESQDVKKGTKPATWLKLAQSYIKLYDAELGAGAQLINTAGDDIIALTLADDPVISEENVVVSGTKFVKRHYATHNYYFDESGVIRIAEISKSECPDALDKAFDAYRKAWELDVKGQKKKDVVEGYKVLNTRYRNEAETRYRFADYPASALGFVKAATASEQQPLGLIDTTSCYNAAYVSLLATDYSTARKYYEKCLAIGYYDEGTVYAKLSEIAAFENDKVAQQDYLEKGFVEFPRCQYVLYGLINFYRENNMDSSKLFTLIDKAKEQEPENPSIYVVEGDTHEKLGEIEAAAASYNKAIEVDSEFPGGYVGLGFMYFNQASDLSAELMNVDDEKTIGELTERLKNNLRACIEPLEKVVEISPENKVNALKGLKAACFQLRLDDTVYMDKYNKYKEMYDSLGISE